MLELTISTIQNKPSIFKTTDISKIIDKRVKITIVMKKQIQRYIRLFIKTETFA